MIDTSPYYIMIDSDHVKVTPEVWQRRYPWKDPVKLQEHLKRVREIELRNLNANQKNR